MQHTLNFIQLLFDPLSLTINCTAQSQHTVLGNSGHPVKKFYQRTDTLGFQVVTGLLFILSCGITFEQVNVEQMKGIERESTWLVEAIQTKTPKKDKIDYARKN